MHSSILGLVIAIINIAEAFHHVPSIHPPRTLSRLHTTRAILPLSRLSMSGQSAAISKPTKSGAEIRLGPHIKLGKKGTVLNPWGVWVMTYSVAMALVGFAYLKIRQLIGFLTFGLLKPRAEHCCWIMHMWCKIVLFIGLSNPTVDGLENLPLNDETILVAANHMSWFDVPALHGYLGSRKLWSFAKAELVNVPILGTYMKSAEHILISRHSRKSQMESLKNAIATIKQKRDVFIFPEGTRSLDGKLRPFKGGAFTIARKTGAKIVPVTLLGNNLVFPSNAVSNICVRVCVCVCVCLSLRCC
jgi:1-acyl-sn-glycerol-3-phosphate acyltransferase